MGSVKRLISIMLILIGYDDCYKARMQFCPLHCGSTPPVIFACWCMHTAILYINFNFIISNPKLGCHCMAIIWCLSSVGRAPLWSGGRPWFDSMRHHCNQSYTKYDLNNINYLGDVKGIHVSSNLALIIKFLILLSWDGKAVFFVWSEKYASTRQKNMAWLVVRPKIRY